MKSIFPEYFRPTEEEFKQLWRECVFVFDTNALLDLHRLPLDASNELLEKLFAIQDRIWIPHQVVLEYVRKKDEVIVGKRKTYDSIRSVFEKSFNQLREDVPKINGIRDVHKDLVDILTGVIDDFESAVKSEIENYRENLEESAPDQDTVDKIASLFSAGNIGKPYSIEELKKIYDEGQLRYDNNIPPGYKDKEKPEPDRYGDLVIWFQILDYAKESGKPIIFMTGDNKDDWWDRTKGETVGPSSELRREMLQKTQVQYYSYTVKSFIHKSPVYLQVSYSEETQEAVSELQDLNSDRYFSRDIQSVDQAWSRSNRTYDPVYPFGQSDLAGTMAHHMVLTGDERLKSLTENLGGLAIGWEDTAIGSAAKVLADMDLSKNLLGVNTMFSNLDSYHDLKLAIEEVTKPQLSALVQLFDEITKPATLSAIDQVFKVQEDFVSKMADLGAASVSASSAGILSGVHNQYEELIEAMRPAMETNFLSQMQELYSETFEKMKVGAIKGLEPNILSVIDRDDLEMDSEPDTGIDQSADPDEDNDSDKDNDEPTNEPT